MTIIGIDPGQGGAIACWNKGIKSYKCPQNVETMAGIVEEFIFNSENIYAYIEQVHAMPHDGRSSLFKFGTNYGAWLGILASYQIHTIQVSPQKWMKYWQEKLDMKLPKDKPSRKRQLKEIASHYTDKKVTLYNADAILITMYGLYDKRESNNE